jgi:hypothetical protein
MTFPSPVNSVCHEAAEGHGLGQLLANNFHERPLPPVPIELSIKDLFPRAEVKFAVGDRDDDFPAHDLAFEMGVGVVFTGAVVMVLRGGRVRREFFEPDLVVVMEAALVVVDENGGGGVRCLFVTAVLLPPFRRSQPAGNARKLFQTNNERLAITLKHEGFNFICSRRMLQSKSGFILRLCRIGSAILGCLCPVKSRRLFTFWDTFRSDMMAH